VWRLAYGEQPRPDDVSFRGDSVMPGTRIAVTIDADLLVEIDRRVADGEFSDRSGFFNEALGRLSEQCLKRGVLRAVIEKLDPVEERSLAEEGLLPTARRRTSP
jgi:Arc/MetJ-type ribon-helix-helix transcriptional regulator